MGWWVDGLMRGSLKSDATRATSLRRTTHMSTLLTYLALMTTGAWALESLFFFVQWRAMDRESL